MSELRYLKLDIGLGWFALRILKAFSRTPIETLNIRVQDVPPKVDVGQVNTLNHHLGEILRGFQPVELSLNLPGFTNLHLFLGNLNLDSVHNLDLIYWGKSDLHGLADHKGNDSEMTNLSLPNLTALQVSCVNLAVSIDLISRFRHTAVHTLSIESRARKEQVVSLCTNHLGALIPSVRSINCHLTYKEFPYFRNLSRLAPNTQKLSVNYGTGYLRVIAWSPPDVGQGGCTTFAQFCSNLMPREEEVPFPYLNNLEVKLPVQYLDKPQGKPFGHIKDMMLDLLAHREAAGAIPLRLVSSSQRKRMVSGFESFFWVSFQATVTTK
jgi:hypothetical protein